MDRRGAFRHMNTPTYPPRYALYPGQGPPRRFTALSWLRGLPGLAERFSGVVPGEYWSEDVDGEERVGVISCVCGETARARENRLTPCRCERVFILLGDSIRVAKL